MDSGLRQENIKILRHNQESVNEFLGVEGLQSIKLLFEKTEKKLFLVVSLSGKKIKLKKKIALMLALQGSGSQIVLCNAPERRENFPVCVNMNKVFQFQL